MGILEKVLLITQVLSLFSPQIVRHGGALGLGLAALGTARQDVYDLLKSNLYQDDAVTGRWIISVLLFQG